MRKSKLTEEPTIGFLARLKTLLAEAALDYEALKVASG
jgi:hypothetical protein